MIGSSRRLRLHAAMLWPALFLIQSASADVFEIPWWTIDGGGVMRSEGGAFELSGTIGQPDAGQAAAGSFELTGGFWAGGDAAPFVMHGVTAATSPCTGYIDPRIESDNGVDANLGVSEVTFAFSEPVYHTGGLPVDPPDASSFTVTETGAGLPPSVAGVVQVSPTTYTVQLDRVVTLSEWTTIVAHVQDAGGNPIVSGGDQGAGAAEPDRIDVGRLPGDVNQDGIVSPQDLINLRQFLIAGSYHNDCDDLLYFDIDRDGVMPEPQDLLRFRQMLGGASPATRPWALASMNATQP
jgi:hypothetical protein